MKDNALIEASHRLSEIEHRLILLAIVKARSLTNNIEELKNMEFVIHASEYMEHYKVNKGTAYLNLKKAVIGLHEAKWGYKYLNKLGNRVVQLEHFTKTAKYIDSEGTVIFSFSDAIIPLLIQLERSFTQYEIKQIADLKSAYSMRMYEFLMQQFDKVKRQGWLEITLEDLRFRLGLLPSEYERMGNFKSRVLDYSVSEINENTHLNVKYEQQKQGRVITGFRFEFSEKESEKPKPKLPKSPDSDLFKEAGFTEIEQAKIEEKVVTYIAKLEKKIGKVTALYKTNIMKKAIRERWGLEEIEEDEIKKEKKNIEAEWKSIPNGTLFKYRDKFYSKEGDILMGITENRSMPFFSSPKIWADLEIIDSIE